MYFFFVGVDESISSSENVPPFCSSSEYILYNEHIKRSLEQIPPFEKRQKERFVQYNERNTPISTKYLYYS